MSLLSSKLDQLGMQFDLEKDGFDYFKQLQEENFQFFTKDPISSGQPIVKSSIDISTLNSVTKLPTKPIVPPLSDQLANFKSQQAYIESLNLREVCF